MNQDITEENVLTYLSAYEICCASAASMNSAKQIVFVIKTGNFKVQHNEESREFEELRDAVEYYNTIIV